MPEPGSVRAELEAAVVAAVLAQRPFYADATAAGHVNALAVE